MTFQTSSMFLDSYTEIDRMLLSFVSLRKGWITALDELMPHACRWGGFDEFVDSMKKATAVVPPVAPALDELSVAEIAAALADKEKATVKSAAAYKAEGKSQVAKDIARSKNTMHSIKDSSRCRICGTTENVVLYICIYIKTNTSNKLFQISDFQRAALTDDFDRMFC